MADLELLSPVAVLRDLPEDGLVRGQVGTIVEELLPGAWLVEFSDKSGHAYSIRPLKSEDLMRLYHAPVEESAN